MRVDIKPGEELRVVQCTCLGCGATYEESFIYLIDEATEPHTGSCEDCHQAVQKALDELAD